MANQIASLFKRKRRIRRAALTRKQQVQMWAKRIGLGLVAAVLLGALSFSIAYAVMPIPNPNTDFTTNTSFVMYRDGKTRLGSFAVQNRQTIAYSEMPQMMKDAVVAAENRTFWTDPGISIAGMGRAVIATLTGRGLQGGSTITQEYIKVLYLTQDRNIFRKFTEIVLAMKMGNTVPKEQILEGYLNTVWFSRGAYGIQAAAQAYFGVDAKNLNTQQCAALAAIINNPYYLDPANGTKAANDLLQRYQYTLNGLVEIGKLTADERQAIYGALPAFPKVASDARFGGPKGFLLKMIQDELLKAGFSDAQINGGGLQIISTFDQAAQDGVVKAAQDVTASASSSNKANAKDLHAAVASVEVGTGEVLALYGGPDYVANSRNWATTDRPAGSTFKTWALIAGLRDGMKFSDTFNGNAFIPPGDSVPVANHGISYGTVDLIKATSASVNTAYVELVMRMKNGPSKVVKAANDAGIATGAGWDLNNRIALGVAEVSPLEAAGGYATLGNGGKRVANHVVREVRDSTGQLIYSATPAQDQTIEPDIARNATYVLTKVTTEGTGATAGGLGRDVAGKTGTAYTGERTNASWFVGYTKQISTAAMFVAGDDGNQDLEAFAPGFYGGGFPTQLWLKSMQVEMKNLPNLRFDQPNPSAFGTPSATPSDTPTLQISATSSATATATSSTTGTPTLPPSLPPTTTSTVVATVSKSTTKP